MQVLFASECEELHETAVLSLATKLEDWKPGGRIRSENLMKSKQALYDKYAVVDKNNLNFKQLFDYFK